MNELQQPEKVIDINKIIGILGFRWYIIVSFLIIALGISYINLRYSTPIYESLINLRFEDEKGSQISELFRFGRSGARLENQMKTETEILKSRTMLLKTLSEMNIPFSYELQGKITKSKLYPNDGFEIETLYFDSIENDLNFTLTFNDNRSFVIQNGTSSKSHTFRDTLFIHNNIIRIKLLDKEKIASLIGIPIRVSKNDFLALASQLVSNIEVEAIKGTSLFEIKFKSDMPEFAKDFVNKLADVYIKHQVHNKSLAAEQTIDFIVTQLDNFSRNVDYSQQELSDFKARNKGVTPDELGRIELSKIIKYESDKVIESLKLELLDKAIKDVNAAKDKPVELIILDGVESASASKFKELFNQLILERLSLQQVYGPESKRMQELEMKINNAKEAFIKSLINTRTQISDKIQILDKQISETNAILSNLPGKQLDLVNLERTYKVNEKIFSFLQEKRLETMIQRASIIPSTSVVDPCISSQKIYPNEEKQYIISVSISLALSIALIMLLRVVYDKVPDKETIESLSKVPVIGVIKRVSSGNHDRDYNIHALSSPKSIFSESIRGIRTNVNFLLMNQNHKIISLTSTVSGEGKTFCTLNLAASLTLLDYKVVIIGCDLRRPKLHLSFPSIDNKVGLTSYLFGKHTKDQIIHTTPYEGLFIVPAGPVPPNPSELLQSVKMENFLAELKQEYDFVFLDTSPVGLVSDSLTLMKLSDLNIYVLRAQYSKRDFALVPDRLKVDNEIPNIYTILNAFDPKAAFYGSIYKTEYGGYYGGGGYYYYGGYYGKGAYGYYGRRHSKRYYSEYYAPDDLKGPEKLPLGKRVRNLFKKEEI